MKKHSTSLRALAALATMFASTMFASTLSQVRAAAPETLRVEAPWARETAPGQRDGGAFMTLVNEGAADQLVAASSPACEQVQIHTVQMENGVMRMRELPEGIAIPAAGRVELKPGSLHIMFIRLNQPLKAGEQVPVTLKFRTAGEKTVRFEVRSVAATPQPAHSTEPKASR